MSRHAAGARSGKDRTSLYQEITDKIIAELEAGRVPWVQPWGTAAAKASLTMPKNAATQRQYSGINVLILWDAVIEHGFSAQNWLTFRQALGLGGHVRKGEHGTTVVYADRFVPDSLSSTPTSAKLSRGSSRALRHRVPKGSSSHRSMP
jgi:antirestriction protein ArdC